MKRTRRSFLGLAAGMAAVAGGCGPPKARVLPTVDAREQGLVGDGHTNERAALQRLVNRLAASGGGTIHLPAGLYLLSDKPILWRSMVSLVGDGPGRTVVKLSNASNRSRSLTFIRNTAQTGASIHRPLTDCIFDNFELDGSDVDIPRYDFGAKGFNIQYMLRAKFSRLFVHDTVGSGIGCDFLKDSVIEGCTASGCGRLNDGTQGGGAGIGIGVGGYPDESGGSWQNLNLEVTDCVTNGNRTHGLFFESQSQRATYVQSGDIRVTGHRSTGNRFGISDWGCDGLSVSASRATANHLDGFNVGHGVGGYASGGRGGRLRDVDLSRNGRHGFALVATPPGRYSIKESRLSGNRGDGMLISTGSDGGMDLQAIVCETSSLTANGSNGLCVLAPTSGLVVERCVVTDNGKDTDLPWLRRAGIALLGSLQNERIASNDLQSRSDQPVGIGLSTKNAALAGGLRETNRVSAPGGVAIAAK